MAPKKGQALRRLTVSPARLRLLALCAAAVGAVAALIVELLIVRALALGIDSHSDAGLWLGVLFLSAAIVFPLICAYLARRAWRRFISGG